MNLLEHETLIRIYPKKLLDFFDHRQKDNGFGTQTSGIINLIGEDLVLGLYMHHLQYSGRENVDLVSYQCSTGQKRGPRLDAWIAAADNVLRQVEVKNWAANAIGGEQVDPEPDENDLVASARRTFSRYFTNPKVKEKVLKVFQPMRKPDGYERFKVLPVLAVWSVISNKRITSPCFRVTNTYQPKSPFKKLEVFSASLYLRQQRKNHLCIYMPRFRRRMELLNSFAQVA